MSSADYLSYDKDDQVTMHLSTRTFQNMIRDIEEIPQCDGEKAVNLEYAKLVGEKYEHLFDTTNQDAARTLASEVRVEYENGNCTGDFAIERNEDEVWQLCRGYLYNDYSFEDPDDFELEDE